MRLFNKLKLLNKLNFFNKYLFIILFFVISIYYQIDKSFAITSTFRTSDDLLGITLNTDSGTKIELESDNINLYISNIKWFIDGELLLEGENQTTFESQSSYTGKKVKVEIKNISSSYTASFNISGNNINIYWEGVNNYIPKWWQGKANVAYGGQVSLWVMGEFYDNDQRIQEKDVNYWWYISDEYDKKRSGFGKNSSVIDIPNTTFDDLKITVKAFNKAGEALAEKTIYIEQSEIEINIYKQSLQTKESSDEESSNTVLEPENIFDIIMLKNFQTIYNKNFNIIIEPFLFNNTNKNLLTYSWSINNQDYNNNTAIKGFTILSDENKDFRLDLYASNNKKIGEYKNKTLNLYTFPQE